MIGGAHRWERVITALLGVTVVNVVYWRYRSIPLDEVYGGSA